MSNAIAQSATHLAVSGVTEESFDFQKAARNASIGNHSGITLEKRVLNLNKLRSSVLGNYRSTFCAIYAKKNEDGSQTKLPQSVYDKATEACEAVIRETLSRINSTNVISYKRGFYWNESKAKAGKWVVEREVATAENLITLKQQHLGLSIYIREQKELLNRLYSKPSPDFDREAEAKRKLGVMEQNMLALEAEIAVQEQLSGNKK